MKKINTFDICYIIKVNENSSGETFFFEIEKNKIDKIEILRFITKLPINIHYFTMTLEDRVESKLKGLTNGYVIKIIQSWDEVSKIPYQIKVIFSDERIPSHLDNSVCVIEPSKITDPIRTTKDIYAYISNNMKIESMISARTIPANNFIVSEDTYSRSTLLSFESNGYTFKYSDNSNENHKLLSLHTNTVNYIQEQEHNRDIMYLNKFSYILTDFSIDNFFIEKKKELSKSNLRKKYDNKEDADKIYESITLAKNSIVNGDEINQYYKYYLSEINYIDTLIGIYSCSTFSPTLKSDCYINDVYSDMNDLANAERRNNYNDKVGLLSRRISTILTKKCENIAYNLEQSAIHPIKIISNLPLEWVLSNKLPLMINCPVSRIPKTPIYLMEQLILENNFNIILDHKSLFKILIIRSYKKDDKLKNQLKSYIADTLSMLEDNFKKNTKTALNHEVNEENFEISFKDVHNSSELIETLNNSHEQIVIFDMHGGHDASGEGYLHINDDNVIISSLYDKIKRIPPIVILSSCDTSPIDRNSFNISSAFLLLGARSVLGSAMPINGHESARFISRLLIRIKYYLPEYFAKYDAIRWSNLIHGMQKREYFTDLIAHLHTRKIIQTVEEKIYINNEIGLFIENYFRSDLLDKVIEIISIKIDKSKHIISNEIESNFFFAESIKYFHLGLPENIIISSKGSYDDCN
ncbi:CHAT domain-containing protein [Salmonella enterica subsp. enterica serovar Sangera]|nr:CHAT domain-containing protein [Salmonella enterica subsp. enterica serovar Sangera]